ncbi:hypothetical protein K458DRAFT_414219 [Lentithecium fluviatile CBS 122367]|uniref:Uncharacterized protein n=1 Tax=Lentithecium fluviatile CBS 122367 TaxID=1168545 RepID=A0A6G1JEA8_9PLEO|nr:hypothetical protein K458DRAFT_414219 [Lentithecium fluviatile CBS 122367]
MHAEDLLSHVSFVLFSSSLLAHVYLNFVPETSPIKRFYRCATPCTLISSIDRDGETLCKDEGTLTGTRGQRRLY